MSVDEPGARTAAHSRSRSHSLGAEAVQVDEGYLAQRQLRSSTAGWLLLAGLGASAVISEPREHARSYESVRRRDVRGSS